MKQSFTLVAAMMNSKFAMCRMMKWSSRVKTSFLSIGGKSKVNTHHYDDNVLKPFLKKDIPRGFPGGDKNMILHQNSA